MQFSWELFVGGERLQNGPGRGCGISGIASGCAAAPHGRGCGPAVGMGGGGSFLHTEWWDVTPTPDPSRPTPPHCTAFFALRCEGTNFACARSHVYSVREAVTPARDILCQTTATTLRHALEKYCTCIFEVQAELNQGPNFF